MKILIVTGIFPPDIGGPATYVPKIAGHLTLLGHNVDVLTLSDERSASADDYSFRVVRIHRSFNQLLRVIITMATVVRLGRKADLIFVNGLYLEASVANLLVRTPEIHKVVGDLAWERSTAKGWVSDDFETYQTSRYGFKVEFVRWLRGWWSRRAKNTIVPSDYLARWVRAWGIPEEKVTVVYNGVDPQPTGRKVDLVLPSGLKVVTIARLVSWKGVEGIIHAVAQLDEAQLIVIGDGPLRNHLQAHARRIGASERVLFAGAREKSEISGILSECDVFVLNSTYEGLPHVVLEAMASELPVLATTVGGTSELVQDGINGLLVKSGDPQALLDALSRLVGDAALRLRLADQGAKTVKKFTNQQMFEQTERVLVEAVR